MLSLFNVRCTIYGYEDAMHYCVEIYLLIMLAYYAIIDAQYFVFQFSCFAIYQFCTLWVNSNYLKYRV